MEKGRIILINFQYVLDSLDTEEQRITAEFIFEKYKNMMYHTAYDVLKNRCDAEDAVADTLIKVCRNIDKLMERAEKEQKLLVREYTKNTALDRYREKERKPSDSLDEILLNQNHSDEDEEEAGIEMEELSSFQSSDFGGMQKYVMKLPEKYKDILVMRYGEELKNKEIAELLHMSESTVATRIERAKKLLKKMYENDGGKHE